MIKTLACLIIDGGSNFSYTKSAYCSIASMQWISWIHMPSLDCPIYLLKQVNIILDNDESFPINQPSLFFQKGCILFIFIFLSSWSIWAKIFLTFLVNWSYVGLFSCPNIDDVCAPSTCSILSRSYAPRCAPSLYSINIFSFQPILCI